MNFPIKSEICKFIRQKTTPIKIPALNRAVGHRFPRSDKINLVQKLG